MRAIKKAYIEITNRCNLSCPFCPGTRRSPADMSAAAFDTVLERLRGRVQCLYFHVMGEPLLHPEMGRFLDRAYEAGLPVNLTTNGTLLGEVGGMLVTKPALRQVNVSLHSQTGRSNNAYLDDVLAFVHQAQRAGILMALRLWNERAGEPSGENEEMLNYLAKEFGLDRSCLNAKQDGRGVRLAEGVYLNRASLFEWPDLGRGEQSDKGFCMGLRDQVGVLCDGTVVPCCLDGEGAVPLGNLLEQPLENILAAPRARALHEGFSHRQAVEELCRKCGYRQRFN